MFSRAITAGLTSVGIEVQNLESMPISISRYYVKVQRASGLVHVRVSQRSPDKVTIEFFDSQGAGYQQGNGKENRSHLFQRRLPTLFAS